MRWVKIVLHAASVTPLPMGNPLRLYFAYAMCSRYFHRYPKAASNFRRSRFNPRERRRARAAWITRSTPLRLVFRILRCFSAHAWAARVNPKSASAKTVIRSAA